MKARTTVIVLFAMLTLAVVASNAQPRERIYLFGTADERGRETSWEVSVEDARRASEWLPTDGCAPDFATALAAARTAALKRHPKVDDLVLVEVSLRPISDTSARNRWYYMFSFMPVIDDQSFFGGQFSEVVLLGGGVVEPRAGGITNR